MQRGEIGRYEVTSAGGEHVRAFVPAPLPPVPALALEGSLQQLLEAASLGLGRLVRWIAPLPDHSATKRCHHKGRPAPHSKRSL